MGIDGIEIAKLSAKMQEFVAKNNIDDGNGILEDAKGEVGKLADLLSDAIQRGEANEEDFKAIFGSEIRTPQVVTSPVQHELSKKDKKEFTKDIKNTVEELVKKNVAPEELIPTLGNKFANPDYKPIIDEVNYVLDLVKATNYNSKEDVEKIHDTVKKQLKAANKWDSFHKDILDSLEKQAKTAQITKEFEELKKQYTEVKATMQKTEFVQQNGDNFKAYLEIVKDNLQKKGADKKKPWDKSYTKEAFEQLEQYARADASAVTMDRINHFESDDRHLTHREIRSELRTQNKGGDDFQNDAIQDLKTERKIKAREINKDNRAADITRETDESLKKDLGYDLWKKLNRKYLGTLKNPDNQTYDMSKMSELISKYAGSNVRFDQSLDDEMAEIDNVTARLNYELGFSKGDKDALTTGEVKDLIKYVKIKRQHNDHMPKVLETAKDGFKGLVAGVGSHSDIDVTQTVDILFENATQAEEMMEQLTNSGLEADITLLDNNQAMVRILQKVAINDLGLSILKGMGINILTGALMDVIFGNKHDEKSCISVSDYDNTDPTYTDPEKFKAYAASKYADNPAKIKAINTLVDAYKAEYGDKWHEQFWQNIREHAGIGSRMHGEECRALRMQAAAIKPEDIKPQVEPPKVEPPKVEPPKVEPPKVEAPKESPCKLVFKEDINMKDSNKYYWEEIINMYYSDCLKENGGQHTMKEIRFKLREINGIPNDYRSIPANLKLPYDLFGDGSCARTQKKTDVKLRQRVKPDNIKLKTIQTPQGGWMVGCQCPNKQGGYDTSWNPVTYPNKAAAEKAGKQIYFGEE